MLVIPGKKTVTVVDSIMGSGKTSWAIQFINQSPEYIKFIFITPYKSEVIRIINSTAREFVQPESTAGFTKMKSLKEIISKGKNIAATHKLFESCDAELIRLLNAEHYILILDESLNSFNSIDITKADIQVLLRSKTDPVISVDDRGFVTWLDEDYDTGKFSAIRNIANAGNLVMYKNISMYWLFPVEVFNCFDKVYILTYMFKGQIQCNYFDYLKVPYEFKAVGYNEVTGYHLVPYRNNLNEDRGELKRLINIHYSSVRDKRDMNKIGEERTAFSVNHLKRSTKDKHYVKMIRDNIDNFCRHKVDCNKEDIIWTTFNDYKDKIVTNKISGRFVPINAKATNEYANATACIYLGNRFLNPLIKQFFHSHGVKVDDDLFALSELLQWLFRSNIRNGGKIDVYIPSRRMRTLLEKYLDNEI
ncbi:hypothetical protein QUF56_17390 [Ureibacillus composti]|nr:hypothetical protein [Ureibacillus composti]